MKKKEKENNINLKENIKDKRRKINEVGRNS